MRKQYPIFTTFVVLDVLYHLAFIF